MQSSRPSSHATYVFSSNGRETTVTSSIAGVAKKLNSRGWALRIRIAGGTDPTVWSEQRHRCPALELKRIVIVSEIEGDKTVAKRVRERVWHYHQRQKSLASRRLATQCEQRRSRRYAGQARQLLSPQIPPPSKVCNSGSIDWVQPAECRANDCLEGLASRDRPRERGNEAFEWLPLMWVEETEPRRHKVRTSGQIKRSF